MTIRHIDIQPKIKLQFASKITLLPRQMALSAPTPIEEKDIQNHLLPISPLVGLVVSAVDCDLD